MIKNLIFDLDGTLLDTLPDITTAINDALKKCGYDYSFSYPENKTLIGHGPDYLVHKALKDKDEDVKAFNELRSVYMHNYATMQNMTCKPFEGIMDVLKELNNLGMSLFVVTNKPDQLANEIICAHFNSLFKGVYGYREGNPVKPDPLLLNDLFNLYGLENDECLYIGDSQVDVETAKNKGIKSVLVTWGYDNYIPSLLRLADYVINSPNELTSLLLKLNNC